MDIFEKFKEWTADSYKAQKLWQKIEDKKATFKDAEDYAKAVGAEWSRLLLDEFGDDLTDEDYEVITNALKKDYSESAYYSKMVQRLINENAKIGMKSLEPRVDESRITNLIDKLKDGADKKWMFSSEVIGNISRSAVSDTISYNARVQSDAGLHAYITRDAGAGCCAWCQSLAGTYEYGRQPSDFFAVHDGCTCTIEYHPAKRAIQRIRYESGRKITS